MCSMANVRNKLCKHVIIELSLFVLCRIFDPKLERKKFTAIKHNSFVLLVWTFSSLH